ncbi:MAG: hypothetical protein R6V50_07270 [Thermoplasmatota archaeon]
MKRELAWRVFAGEYNDSKIEIKNSGEKTPSHLITPLGSKVNRLFIIGVLTDVEQVTEGGDFIRAHISDPTGVFTLYSGQFQQEATDQLLQIDVPAFVGVVGKIRTYTPDDGDLYVSIRPELVRQVTAEARSQWILETCMQTKQRIQALTEAMKMNQPTVTELRKLGYSKELSEGVIHALQEYKQVDIERYISLIRESMVYVGSQQEPLSTINKKEIPLSDIEQNPDKKTKKEIQKKPQKEPFDDKEDQETTVLDVIKKIEDEDGAAWDLIIEKCKNTGLDEDTIEEVLTSLMDKGLIFEPVLGIIKTT